MLDQTELAEQIELAEPREIQGDALLLKHLEAKN